MNNKPIQSQKAKTHQRNKKAQSRSYTANQRTGEGPLRSVPVAFTQTQGSKRAEFHVPKQKRFGDQRICVTHREYVADVNGSTSYSVNSLSINPGLSALFPWLSQIANNYEKYLFKKLKFDYRTQSPTSALGKVILSVDWDAADPAPTTKQQQLQDRTKADDAVWQNFSMNCDTNDIEGFGINRFIRSTSLAANLDIKTYDVGNLLIGTQGAGTSAPIGELYVDYEVELITPQPTSNIFAQVASFSSSGTGSTPDAPLGTAPTTSGDPIAVIDPTGSYFTFPSIGSYLVNVALTGTVITGPIVIGGDTTVTALANASANSATVAYTFFKCNPTGVGEIMSIAVPATTVTSCIVTIEAASPAFSS